MKIAVTGASGFIGSNICKELNKRGHEVISLVRPDLDNLKKLADKLKEVETVCHCAWSGHPRNEVESQRNIFTSLTVAKAASLSNVQHMVFMSSGGGINSQTAYASSKREVESLLSSEFGLFDFDLTILRPTAVYGPGQDPSKGLGAVVTFVEAVRTNKPIHILGSPYSGRDFLHVYDLAECTCDVIEKRALGLFEIGGPEVIRLNELIEIVEKAFSKKAIVQVENPTGIDPQVVKLDNSLLIKSIGWTPQRTLSSSINDIIRGV